VGGKPAIYLDRPSDDVEIQIIRWSSQMATLMRMTICTLLLCYSVRGAEIQSMGLTTKQLRHLEQENSGLTIRGKPTI
jgi:hypothetical protein